ncbi:FXYD domain-containing ion transport regulator 3-like, partial [Gallus gallus]|uniref:FXYD domain-containing ion transport regulator 3-like n=1 Tax=Gallus gallus TaxID=9031 RepID=UPI001AE3710B
MVCGSVGVLVVLAVLPLAGGNMESSDVSSPFQYDWHQLRVGGLVVAAVLCVTGIVILVSECHLRGGVLCHLGGSLCHQW